MSVDTTPSPEQRVECGHCEERFPLGTAVADAYCSTDCYYRAKGAGILSDLEHDHTVCSTCFATLKETSHPGEETLQRNGVSTLAREAFVGFEHLTNNAQRADGAPHPASPDEHGVLREDPSTSTPTACKCGAIEHDRDETIERVEGADVLLNLWGQLCKLYTRGAIDHAPSKDRLFAGLREQGRDWAYAVGFSLYGGEA